MNNIQNINNVNTFQIDYLNEMCLSYINLSIISLNIRSIRLDYIFKWNLAEHYIFSYLYIIISRLSAEGVCMFVKACCIKPRELKKKFNQI